MTHTIHPPFSTKVVAHMNQNLVSKKAGESQSVILLSRGHFLVSAAKFQQLYAIPHRIAWVGSSGRWPRVSKSTRLPHRAKATLRRGSYTGVASLTSPFNLSVEKTPKDVSVFHLEQPKHELTGETDVDPKDAILAAAPEFERWDPLAGSTGNKMETTSKEDEDGEGRSDNERIVEEGFSEVEHDQMGRPPKPSRKRMNAKDSSREGDTR